MLDTFRSQIMMFYDQMPCGIPCQIEANVAFDQCVFCSLVENMVGDILMLISSNCHPMMTDIKQHNLIVLEGGSDGTLG